MYLRGRVGDHFTVKLQSAVGRKDGDTAVNDSAGAGDIDVRHPRLTDCDGAIMGLSGGGRHAVFNPRYTADGMGSKDV